MYRRLVGKRVPNGFTMLIYPKHYINDHEVFYACRSCAIFVVLSGVVYCKIKLPIHPGIDNCLLYRISFQIHTITYFYLQYHVMRLIYFVHRNLSMRSFLSRPSAWGFHYEYNLYYRYLFFNSSTTFITV